MSSVLKKADKLNLSLSLPNDPQYTIDLSVWLSNSVIQYLNLHPNHILKGSFNQLDELIYWTF